LRADFLFGNETHGDGVPNSTVASANGDYVFFETIAALVPQDTDGEIPPGKVGSELPEFVRSPSSDTYEWRKNGVDGCGEVQGCVSLISGGVGGYKTELLGTTPSGRDVFFATHEQLVGQDKDNAGDIYDARIGGGFPSPAPGPVECEGDACSTPSAAPNDVTPASSVFSGVGNVVPMKPVAKRKATKKVRKAEKMAKKKERARRKARRGGSKHLGKVGSSGRVVVGGGR